MNNKIHIGRIRAKIKLRTDSYIRKIRREYGQQQFTKDCVYQIREFRDWLLRDFDWQHQPEAEGEGGEGE